MILQSLTELFDRIEDKEGNPYGVPTPGYSVQNITFRIVLNPDGSLVDIQDAREIITETSKSGKTTIKQIARQILAPDLGGRSRNTKPYFLCDKLSYLTGFDKDADRKNLALEHFNSSKQFHLNWQDEIGDEEYRAVCRHFENFDLSNHLDEVSLASKYASTGVGVFRVLPSIKDVHEIPSVRKFWVKKGGDIKGKGDDAVYSQCLVTGEISAIARLHEPKMRGFGQDSPSLVSFNDNAYTSYGKEQSYNAPVSETAVFSYCNALNALLYGPQSHRHRINISDVTILFWTEKKSSVEPLFASLLGGDIDSNAEIITTEDQTRHRHLHAILNILRKGGGASIAELPEDPSTKFYILGLAKMNKSRLAIRFWHVSTIGQLLANLQDHYRNLTLTRKKDHHPFLEPEFPSIQRLLDQTAPTRGGKTDRKTISPVLGGQLMQAVLHRSPYPMTILQGVLCRLRANDPVDYFKAAIIKAVLIRNFNQIIDMSINTERIEPAYLLGRLFAALEKTQEDALGKLNAGIRERFYSSASVTPRSVFPRILRAYTHHLAKLDGGMKTNRERLIQAIHAPLDGYPAHLTLEQQGLFAIGYYHQRQDLYTSKKLPILETESTNA